MQRAQSNGLAWYTFSAAPSAPFRHAVVTRLGGVSIGPLAALNLGNSVGDAPVAVAENHRRLVAALDLPRERVVSPHQVHGRRVARVGPADGGALIPETDALITNAPGVPLLLRFADCAPVLLYDPVQRAVGLVHAGWRGVAAGVVPAALTAMREAFGSHPGDVWAGIGPTIGPDHYVVGIEVVTAVMETLPVTVAVAARRAGRWYLDLPGAIAAQLHMSGVTEVAQAGICTACHTEEWYSHRQEGGHTGRFGVLVMLDD